jgi:NAD(P)H-dependent nitrite reductase small subunit
MGADLDRDLQHLVDTYRCEWAEVVHDPKLREKFREHVNDNDEPPLLVPVRGQSQPASWSRGEASPGRRHLPMLHTSWVPLAKVEEFPKDSGVTYRFGRAQIAVFHVSHQNRWYATQAQCPHKGDAVLGRGILGDNCGVAKVACPFHKRTFSLESGQCTSGEGADILTFPVKVEQGEVYVELPGVAELESLLSTDLRPCDERPSKVSTAAEWQ